MTKSVKTRNFLILQIALVLMSLSGVCLKFASSYALLSFWNIFFYVLAIIILGLYAIIWQHILSIFKLSFAYANSAIGQIWTLTWSWLIFSETIEIKTIIGVAVIVSGIVLLVKEDHE